MMFKKYLCLTKAVIIAAFVLFSLHLHAASLTCAGGDTMIPIMDAWTEALQQDFPQHSILIDRTKKLSADGFEEFLNGAIDCVTFVREPFESEIISFKKKYGHPPFVIPVAGGSFSEKSKTHALAVFVNKMNPINQLDIQQLDAIFSSTYRRGYSGSIKVWGDLGVKGEFADKPIRIYGMLLNRETGNPPGIVNHIKTKVLLGGSFKDDWIEIKDQPGRGSLDLIAEKIAQDPYSIGISGFGNAVDAIKPIDISIGYGKSIPGTYETSKSQTYPLSRRIYLMLRTDKNLRLGNTETQLVNEIYSDRGQKIIESKSQGFLPLPQTQVEALRKSLICESPIPLYHSEGNNVNSDTLTLNQRGAIEIIGYNDMEEIISRWNNIFSIYNSGIIFENNLKGTRTGPNGLVSKRSLIAPMGAPFESDALIMYRNSFDHDPVMFNVAHSSLHPTALSGPIAIFVHKDNPINELNLEDLKNTFVDQSTSNAHLYGMDERTALGKFMLEKIFHEQSFTKSMSRYQQSRDVVNSISKDPNGLGFASAQIENSQVKRLAISINKSSPAIPLNETSIKNGTYPLDRKLLIYVNSDKFGNISSIAKNYLNLVLSCAGQNLVEDQIKHYLPLNSDEIMNERQKLELPVKN